MISKFTESLKFYCLTVAWFHFSLLYIYFPVVMSLIILGLIPFILFFLVFLLIDKIHRESGFTDSNLERMMVAFDPHTTTTPMAAYLYTMESPLDLDYDLYN